MKTPVFLAAAALFALPSFALSSSAAGQVPSDLDRSAAAVRAHVEFLASDLLEGREAGTRGYDIAAAYVASQFAQLGLTPAGDVREGKTTWFQDTPLLAVRQADDGRFALLDRGGAETVLVPGEDVITGRPLGAPELKLNAPLVFAGYGVVAPERGRDDYRGLDVKGKIVVVFQGAPSGFQTEERAYYASVRTKRLAAEANGAVGLVLAYRPSDETRRPFAQMRRAAESWSMTWTRPDGTAFDTAARTPMLATLSVAGANKLFAGARRSYADAVAAAEKPRGEAPRFALPYRLDAAIRTETRTTRSANVAGLLPGSDPKLKDEIVVLSAHLDHVGITAPVDGDSINNGALDNAGGIATTLEVARAFRDSGRAPRRSILFLAVTAEEKGLLGAEYFARNPTVAGTMVANVNLDMPVLTYDFVDVVAFGSERSGIAQAVQRAATRTGVALSPDPMPEEGLFTRSDHFRFVEIGVPSTFLMTGFQNGGEAKFRGFLAQCYHKPCDDLAQPIDYAAGAKFARINYEITRELADADARPLWNRGDFFGVKFGPRGSVAD
ncbi:M28 family metallopeptidase [Phenylobacterium sp. SCN 70-31]|uniref:M28 family metallopeptidase n=1 Tax=Phenylobacterium sp. SCN 70-31 TaxID=1660129 RepID=UPI000B141DF1|nr:M28 family metallopeptidase [Phenylobacterium sp. SCN 70-31]